MATQGNESTHTTWRTPVVWACVAVLTISLLGYEIIPNTERGPWVVITVLMVAGAFMSVAQAFVVGILAFLLTALWLLWASITNIVGGNEALFMFTVSLAPLPLSAMSMALKMHPVFLKAELSKTHRHTFLPLHAFKMVFEKLEDDWEDKHKQRLIALIEISNADEIIELLGKREWSERHQRLIIELERIMTPDEWLFGDAEGDFNHILVSESDPSFFDDLLFITRTVLDHAVGIDYRLVTALYPDNGKRARDLEKYLYKALDNA